MLIGVMVRDRMVLMVEVTVLMVPVLLLLRWWLVVM